MWEYGLLVIAARPSKDVRQCSPFSQVMQVQGFSLPLLVGCRDLACVCGWVTVLADVRTPYKGLNGN